MGVDWGVVGEELGIDTRKKQKRGRQSPPFLAGRGSYRFLPPFFFPPFAAFLAIGLSPPSCGICARGAFSVSQRRCLQARRRCVHTPLVVASCASEERCPSDSLDALAWLARVGSAAKKSGVQVFALTPPDRSAALSASCRPFSCRPLSSSSPFVPPWNLGSLSCYR